MKQVISGKKLKTWVANQFSPPQICLPSFGLFEPTSYRQLNETTYYLVVNQTPTELLIEPVRLEH